MEEIENDAHGKKRKDDLCHFLPLEIFCFNLQFPLPCQFGPTATSETHHVEFSCSLKLYLHILLRSNEEKPLIT